MVNERPSSTGRQKALCILGMHRSGTSVVTRAFNLLGAFVGKEADLMQATVENPLGYWERNDICSFHERLLAAVHRRWDTGLMLPVGWQRSPEVAPYREELKKIVSAVFADRPLWAWKDPRTCILLELWKEILGELGIDLAVVVVVRHPNDVAASLAKRDGFGLDKSCGIWLCHLLAALRSIEGVRFAFIGYDSFLEDPIGQVRRCAAALGITPVNETSDTCLAIGRFVRKDLRHSQTAASALAAVPLLVRELYGLIRQAEANPALCDGVFFCRIRELQEQYSAYAAFFREDLERNLFAQLKIEAAERGARYAEERARVLDRQRREAASALEEIVTSRIWKVTGPARKAVDTFRGRARHKELPEK